MTKKTNSPIITTVEASRKLKKKKKRVLEVVLDGAQKQANLNLLLMHSAGEQPYRAVIDVLYKV